ncbi:MAG: hypothetical protein KKF85_06250 [Gammaproteobacteria bacterium]|nr:hypothetical protein [Rhodocyclaceae bacterium]MBU3907614.1 hypothetical protein [Gammaproteobacteria bacterium]MBU3990898.1 hypothetical protein [Gammaproteobacteria bacterium]MBU4004260.1 hypothetical protein [Gammaproteobacteria bacterium]MBU4019669.1 hypothetical protein [Gammaproteobacteria bacterium]
MVMPLFGCVSSPKQFAKTDVDRLADLHRHEANASLGRLAEKLYRRNPREWKKGGHANLDAALLQLSDLPRYAASTAAGGQRGTILLLAGLREDYPRDRVAAFVGGLGDMLNDAFNGKTEFFILDDLDAQKLHNAARNVEIAAWKLANARRSQPEGDLPAGTPILFSNEMTPVQNLSFEREFGRLVGNLDMLSRIVADKTSRSVVKIAQNLATAVFLPIK